MAGEKRLFDIELNDDLGRRKIELKSKIEAVGTEAEAGTQGEDVDARREELAALVQSIEELQSTIDGKFTTRSPSHTVIRTEISPFFFTPHRHQLQHREPSKDHQRLHRQARRAPSSPARELPWDPQDPEGRREVPHQEADVDDEEGRVYQEHPGFGGIT